VKLKLKTSKIAPALTRKNKKLQVVPKEAHEYFTKVTPVRSGNARRRTRLQSDVIKADYPYAQRLDDGWSRQAPQGMVAPTIRYIKARIAEILG
jgi:hypothetical protein